MEQSASGAPLNMRQVIPLDQRAQKNLRKSLKGQLKPGQKPKFYLKNLDIPMK